MLELAEVTVLPNVDDLRSALLAEARRWPTKMWRSTGAWASRRRTDRRWRQPAPSLQHRRAGAVDFGTALGVIYACQEQGKAHSRLGG
jgi:hypothetical protein